MKLQCLFVGGICDGEWIGVPAEPREPDGHPTPREVARVVERAKPIESVFYRPTATTIRTQTYRAHPFQAGTMRVYIYAPEGWDSSSVLTKLMREYSPVLGSA